MGDYYKLLKAMGKPDNEGNEAASPALDASNPNEPDPFKKFADANKANINPDTSLNVANTFKNAYNGAEDMRSKALDKIAEATDIGTNIPGVGANQDYRKAAKMGLDVAMPDLTDLIPASKIAHAAFPALGMAAKEGKILNFARNGEKTAEDLMQGVRKAGSSDLKIGSNLVTQPVLKTAEEKAAEQLPGAFGKVSTPDMPKQIGSNELMAELQKSKVWNDHIADRDMFKNDNARYMNLKEAMKDAVRKKLGGE